MRIKNYITLLLVVALVGAFGVLLAAGLGWRQLELGAQTSGQASADYKDVESFVANSDELMKVMDILTQEKGGAFVILEGLEQRCRRNLTALDASAREIADHAKRTGARVAG
ncbi:MAG: hypothetical protein IH889_07955, partial [Planctomycetes bacterium]|nr:hypothetical protein [Planctomycetota bacterium]